MMKVPNKSGGAVTRAREDDKDFDRQRRKDNTAAYLRRDINLIGDHTIFGKDGQIDQFKGFLVFWDYILKLGEEYR